MDTPSDLVTTPNPTSPTKRQDYRYAEILQQKRHARIVPYDSHRFYSQNNQKVMLMPLYEDETRNTMGIDKIKKAEVTSVENREERLQRTLEKCRQRHHAKANKNNQEQDRKKAKEHPAKENVGDNPRELNGSTSETFPEYVVVSAKAILPEGQVAGRTKKVKVAKKKSPKKPLWAVNAKSGDQFIMRMFTPRAVPSAADLGFGKIPLVPYYMGEKHNLPLGGAHGIYRSDTSLSIDATYINTAEYMRRMQSPTPSIFQPPPPTPASPLFQSDTFIYADQKQPSMVNAPGVPHTSVMIEDRLPKTKYDFPEVPMQDRLKALGSPGSETGALVRKNKPRKLKILANPRENNGGMAISKQGHIPVVNLDLSMSFDESTDMPSMHMLRLNDRDPLTRQGSFHTSSSGGTGSGKVSLGATHGGHGGSRYNSEYLNGFHRSPTKNDDTFYTDGIHNNEVYIPDMKNKNQATRNSDLDPYGDTDFERATSEQSTDLQHYDIDMYLNSQTPDVNEHDKQETKDKIIPGVKERNIRNVNGNQSILQQSVEFDKLDGDAPIVLPSSRGLSVEITLPAIHGNYRYDVNNEWDDAYSYDRMMHVVTPADIVLNHSADISHVNQPDISHLHQSDMSHIHQSGLSHLHQSGMSHLHPSLSHNTVKRQNTILTTPRSRMDSIRAKSFIGISNYKLILPGQRYDKKSS